MNRRNFVANSSAIASVGLLNTLDAIAETKPVDNQTTDQFTLTVFATNWGFNGTVSEFCAAASKEGYDGVELWWESSKSWQDELFAALKKHKLAIGFLAGSNGTNHPKHLEAFKSMVNEATSQSIQRPMYINCHSGKDFFSYDQNKAFIDFTSSVAQKTGIPIYHETHRGRMLFAAHVTKNFLEKNPELRLTLDISHWCNVHESLLSDQAEAVALALERTGHIHTRIGHEEGPQVNDPRAPEWKSALDAHLGWWDTVVTMKKKANQPLTMLTEFGPPSYLPTLPFTNLPVANQWEINVYMMKLMRERYK